LAQIRPIFVSYRGHRQTDTQTNAGENIFPRFRGDNKTGSSSTLLYYAQVPYSTEFRSWLLADHMTRD